MPLARLIFCHYSTELGCTTQPISFCMWITEGFNIMIAGGYILESILGIQTLLADI